MCAGLCLQFGVPLPSGLGLWHRFRSTPKFCYVSKHGSIFGPAFWHPGKPRVASHDPNGNGQRLSASPSSLDKKSSCKITFGILSGDGVSKFGVECAEMVPWVLYLTELDSGGIYALYPFDHPGGVGSARCIDNCLNYCHLERVKLAQRWPAR